MTQIFAISGGSCSGKTYLAAALAKRLGTQCHVFAQDRYYIDVRILSPDGSLPNFDEPSSIDFPLLMEHLAALKAGHSIAPPTYDFARHYRMPADKTYEPRPIIIVEGMLVLCHEPLLKMFDHIAFVECPESLRFSRRLERDVRERGRTEESVRRVFFDQVVPSHAEHVQPTIEHADVVLDQTELLSNFDGVCDWLISRWTGGH